MILVDAFLFLMALGLLIPAIVLAVESLAARCPSPRGARITVERPRIAVVVPACNEATQIRTTLASLQPQLTDADRLLVVADNCSDETAAIARGCGAEVLERHEPARRGKGYALAAAVEALAGDPPEVVVVIDADCEVGARAIEALAQAAATSDGPVQATYIVTLPRSASAKARLATFAFLTKNLVRPRGLAKLNLPCLLTGSGMAFPWRVIRAVDLATPHAVEDMQLSVDLALAGHPPRPCLEALVSGRLHTNGDAAREQRTRWQHGHLEVLRASVHPLLHGAWKYRQPASLALALELSVPPLSLLALAWALAMVSMLTAVAAGGSRLPLGLLALDGGLLLTAGIVSWRAFGRDLVPARLLLRIPGYAVERIPLYLAYLAGRGRRVWPESPPPVIPDDKVELAGVRFDAITERECIDRLLRSLADRRGGWIATLNLDQLRWITRSPEHAKLCARATMRVADGMPLVWASRLQGTPLPERVTGSNLISSLSAAAAENGYSVFLLGGERDTAADTARVLRQRHPHLRVSGTLAPEIDLANRQLDLDAIVATLAGARPDIVYVALGKAKQEQLIDLLQPHLPQTWFIPVGISFSFVSGAVRRAPESIQRLGLEWAHRLWQEPHRLARRYLIEGIPFGAGLLLRAAVLGRQRRRSIRPRP